MEKEATVTDHNFTRPRPNHKTGPSDLRPHPAWAHYARALREAERHRLLERLARLLKRVTALLDGRVV